MKSARLLMFGLGLAILTCMAATESAVAQEVAQEGEGPCWTCFKAEDGCMYCSADGPIGFADHCSTPRCGYCRLSGLCIFFVMHDGRVSPPASGELPGSAALRQAVPLLAGFAYFVSSPAPTGSATETSRSCDGGIISKWYSPAAESRIRAATSRLRL